MFRNLSQYTGVEVIISVSTFLKRLEQMEKGEGEFGKTGPQARALLAQRGLTAQMVAEATARIGALAHFTPEPISEGPSAAEQKAAEDHLWAWYLEWSAIARVAIKDGRLLRGLGFGQRPRVTHVLPETPRTTPVAPVLAPLVALSPTSATPMLNAVSQ